MSSTVTIGKTPLISIWRRGGAFILRLHSMYRRTGQEHFEKVVGGPTDVSKDKGLKEITAKRLVKTYHILIL